MALRRVGPYELTASIGSGGGGAVFRGRHVELGVERAVKVLSSSSRGAADRFGREAQALASVRHPHVVTVHDSGVDPGGARWLAMELVPGEPLDHVLKRGPLPLDRALEVVAQVARGVEALHAAGIVHRDLKPANVILGRDGRAVVVDLGLALAPDSDHRLTTTGAWVGTPQYVAPEQLCGAVPSPRTDVHGLGLLLYEATTGLPAFSGERAEELLGQVLSTSRPAPSDLDPRLPAALDELVRAAAATDPATRPAHAGLVADALERLRAAPGPSAAAVRRRRRLVRWVAALALVLGLGGAGLLVRGRAGTAVALAPAATSGQPPPPQPTPQPPAPPPPRRDARRAGAVVEAGAGGRVYVAWSAADRLLTLCARDARVCAWSIGERDGVATVTPLGGHTLVRLAGPGHGLAAGPGGEALALLGAGSLPALLEVDLTSGRSRPFSAGASGGALARAEDGVLAVAGVSQVTLLGPGGEPLALLRAPGLPPTAFQAVTATRRLVAASGERKEAKPGDVAAHLVVWRRDGDPASPVVVPSVTRLGGLASSARDPEALLVGWVSGAVTRLRPFDPADEPEHLAAPDDAPTANSIMAVPHGERIRGLAFAPDGLLLASVAGDDDAGRGTAELRWWRLPAGRQPARPVGERLLLGAGVPSSVAVSPDGRWVAIGTIAGAVEVRAVPE